MTKTINHDTLFKWIPITTTKPKYDHRVMLSLKQITNGKLRTKVIIGSLLKTDGRGDHFINDDYQEITDTWDVIAWAGIPDAYQ